MAQHDGPPTDDTNPVEGHPAVESLAAETDDVAEPEPPLLPASEPLRSIFRAIGMVEQVVGSLLLLSILVLVLIQVAQRYLPGTWPWTGELARYSLVWATFLLAGYLIAYPPRHIAIHVVDFVVGGFWLAVIKLFVNLVILVTAVVMIYGSYTLLATDIGQVTPAAELPMRYVNFVPLVGLVLVAVRAVLGIVVDDVPALRARGGDAI
jgi:TRAP-type C4-dicarboxylate transport system permease small subunit